MRKFFALALTLCGAGCSGLIAFDVDSSGQSTIQGSPTGGILPPVFSGFNNLSFSQSSQFQNNNTNKDHISACHLSKLTLKIVSPPGATLGFLDKVDFFITAPNLAKVHIAGLASIPTAATTVDLQIDDRDIAAYAKSDSFSITTEATGRQPQTTTTLQADLKLHINASLL
jgi:hypothetical protein